MKTFASLFAAAAMLTAATAYAESHEWQAPEPKPLGENARCTGEAEFGGNRYLYTNWVPVDPSGRDFDRGAYCRRILETDMQRLFKVKWGQDLPAGAIRVLESP